MPTSATLLDLLTLAAARAAWVAIGWHLVLVVVLVAISKGWRPSGRLAGAFASASCMSVAVASSVVGNAFNGLVFAALAVAIGAVSARDRARIAPHLDVAGIAALAFGAFYPHFVGFPALLYAAPTGVVPCATLYVVGGATLCGFAPRSKAFRWIVAIAALFYGAFGVMRLGVWIDIGLVVVHVMCIHAAHASLPLVAPRARGLSNRAR